MLTGGGLIGTVLSGHDRRGLATPLGFVGYLPGALLGTYLLRARERRFAWEHSVESVLILEVAALLALFVPVSIGWPFAVAIAVDAEVSVAAFAMGLQNTVGRGVNPLGITTTKVTGPLLRLTRSAAGRKRRSSSALPSPDGAGLSPRATFIAVWGAYFGGVVADVLILRINRTLALALPLLLVTEVTIAAPFLDVWRPVGTGSEAAGDSDMPGPTGILDPPPTREAGTDERFGHTLSAAPGERDAGPPGPPGPTTTPASPLDP